MPNQPKVDDDTGELTCRVEVPFGRGKIVFEGRRKQHFRPTFNKQPPQSVSVAVGDTHIVVSGDDAKDSIQRLRGNLTLLAKFLGFES